MLVGLTFLSPTSCYGGNEGDGVTESTPLTPAAPDALTSKYLPSYTSPHGELDEHLPKAGLIEISRSDWSCSFQLRV